MICSMHVHSPEDHDMENSEGVFRVLDMSAEYGDRTDIKSTTFSLHLHSHHHNNQLLIQASHLRQQLLLYFSQ